CEGCTMKAAVCLPTRQGGTGQFGRYLYLGLAGGFYLVVSGALMVSLYCLGENGWRWGMNAIKQPYYRWLISFLLLAVLCGILAYVVDAHHFGFHILVEGAMAFFTLFLTVVIVERLLEHQRREERKEQWAIVRE